LIALNDLRSMRGARLLIAPSFFIAHESRALHH
jgi:hypothetical protein